MEKKIYCAEDQRVREVGPEGFYFSSPETVKGEPCWLTGFNKLKKGDEFCEGILKDMTSGIERNRG